MQWALNFAYICMPYMGLPRWSSGTESACQCGRRGRLRFDPWVRKIPWRRKWQPTPVFLPAKFHRWKSLAGYSPWSCNESDMTEHTHTQATYVSESAREAPMPPGVLPASQRTSVLMPRERGSLYVPELLWLRSDS